MLLLVTLWIAVLDCVSATGWWNLSDTRFIALRSQRDVQANVTLDQLTTIGVGLSKVLLEPYGYTYESLGFVYDLLESQVQTLVLDIYWNEQLRKFQLCPFPFSDNLEEFQNPTNVTENSITCEVNLSLDDYANLINNYVVITNTNLAANMIVLVFNLYSINDGPDPITYDPSLIGSANDTLSSVMYGNFGTELFTPEDLSNIRWYGLSFNASNDLSDSKYGYPRLYPFLFDEKKRILPIIWGNYLNPNSTYYAHSEANKLIFTQEKLGAHFFPSSEVTLLPDDYLDRVAVPWRFTYDSNEDPYTADRIHDVVDSGYSPILNHTLPSLSEIPVLFNYSLWSWETNQPANETVSKLNSQVSLNVTDDDASSSVVLDAYRCGASTDGVWTVANCYELLPIVCRKASDPFTWVLNTNEGTYFDAASDRCSGDWIFSVPKTAIQQQSLNNYLFNIGISKNQSVWIDMNSIAIVDCWVTGGPYRSCPYQKLESGRSFVAMLTPAAVICFVMFTGIFLLKFRTVPVQDNRKHWKKLINEFTENEKEGVPS